MTMPLCFIDTETTGLHTDKQLWEVAIIRREFDVTTKNIDGSSFTQAVKETRYESFVSVDLSNADLFGLNVGRFYERHPSGRMLAGTLDPESSWHEALPHDTDVAVDIARFTHGARFIGAVPSFDAEVLGKFLRKHGVLPTWHYHLIDVCELAIGYLKGREESTGAKRDYYDGDGARMDFLASKLGIEAPGEARHEAMADAEYAMRFWDAVMA